MLGVASNAQAGNELFRNIGDNGASSSVCRMANSGVFLFYKAPGYVCGPTKQNLA